MDKYIIWCCKHHEKIYSIKEDIDSNSEQICNLICGNNTCKNILDSKIIVGTFNLDNNIVIDCKINKDLISYDPNVVNTSSLNIIDQNMNNIVAINKSTPIINFLSNSYLNEDEEINNNNQHEFIDYNKIYTPVKSHNYYISSIETGMGGDCFYYSLAYMLNNINNEINNNHINNEINNNHINIYNPINLRKIVSDYVLEMNDDEFNIHKGVYEGDYGLSDVTKVMLSKIMLCRKYDADDTAISIIANHFKFKFITYMYKDNYYRVIGYENDDYEYIGALFYTGNHYRVGIIYEDEKEIFKFCKSSQINDEINNFINIINK